MPYDDFGNFYPDQSGLDPVGTTRLTGNVSDPGPLMDWASNLSPDHLAQIAAGKLPTDVPPPPPEAMDAMHDHNASQGTPTRSALPFYPPVRAASQQQGDVSTQLSPEETGQSPLAQTGVVQKAKQKLEQFNQAQPYPQGQPQPGTPPLATVSRPDVQRKVQEDTTAADTAGGLLDPITKMWQRGFGPQAAPAPAPVPAPAPAPAAPPPVVAPAPAPVRRQEQPKPAGHDLNPPEKDESRPTDTSSQKKDQEKGYDWLSGLGAALRGVKAPEPLKPPSGFAPSPGRPAAINAPQIAALLGLHAGQVPPSATPSLARLLRGY